MSLDELFSKLKARGNFGHAGRPGKRGGSLPKGGNLSITDLGDVEGEVPIIRGRFGQLGQEPSYSTLSTVRINKKGKKVLKVVADKSKDSILSRLATLGLSRGTISSVSAQDVLEEYVKLSKDET